ncbi:MAG: transposase [Gemmataceae bacterium]
MPPHSACLSELYRLMCPPPDDAELLRRWVKQRDEDAFTALVSRHGRMVHGVCRRILGNTHDAEDAFQAVFLTLARKGAGLCHPEALPGWLHRVAVRLANKARTAASRRRSGDHPSSRGESGGQWRMLPKDFPAWQTVYYYFSQWRDDGTLQRINDHFRALLRL